MAREEIPQELEEVPELSTCGKVVLATGKVVVGGLTAIGTGFTTVALATGGLNHPKVSPVTGRSFCSFFNYSNASITTSDDTSIELKSFGHAQGYDGGYGYAGGYDKGYGQGKDGAAYNYWDAVCAVATVGAVVSYTAAGCVSVLTYKLVACCMDSCAQAKSDCCKRNNGDGYQIIND